MQGYLLSQTVFRTAFLKSPFCVRSLSLISPPLPLMAVLSQLIRRVFLRVKKLFYFFSTFFAKKKAADKRLDSHSGIVVHRRPSHINFDVTVPTYRIASVGFTMALFQPDQSPVAIFFRVIHVVFFFVTYLPIPRGLVPLVRSSPSGRVFFP